MVKEQKKWQKIQDPLLGDVLMVFLVWREFESLKLRSVYFRQLFHSLD